MRFVRVETGPNLVEWHKENLVGNMNVIVWMRQRHISYNSICEQMVLVHIVFQIKSWRYRELNLCRCKTNVCYNHDHDILLTSTV